jgi:hypothetical protein
MPTTVVHCKKQQYDVYIGRPSKWGNPFVIGADGDRFTVIQKYREWLAGKPDLQADVEELQGKRLGCFCAPLPCHGDVLAELAEGKYYALLREDT